MNRLVRQAVYVLFGAALTSPAFAQARHDEKPHGMMQPAQEAVQQGHMQGHMHATGGRHDEGGTTHGQKKPQATGEESHKSDKPSGQ
jgi:hypothetical protein